jgi:hypothetical protein
LVRKIKGNEMFVQKVTLCLFFSLYSPSLTHPLLSPLNTSFNLELKAIKSLLVAFKEINRWRFYEALMTVH